MISPRHGNVENAIERSITSRMNILTFDCESTGATNGTKGNPFSEPNRLCYVGCLFNGSYSDYSIEYGLSPYGSRLDDIRGLVLAADLIVGFNLKYDFHWLRRYGITEYENKKVWDCQAVEFLLTKQRARFPALGKVAEQYGLGSKLDVVKEEYWNKGIDTDAVPEAILKAYLEQDVALSYKVYLSQIQLVQESTSSKQKLVSLINQDLIVLEEMESNGIHLDMEGCESEAQVLDRRISELYGTLSSFWPSIPMLWSSNDHISAALYGGIVKEDYRERYEQTLKSGEVKVKERWSERQHVLPTLVEPLKGTELKKAGYFKTDEQTLRKLDPDKKGKEVIGILLELSKLEKLVGTYYRGYPKLYKEMMWTDGILHGQLNQVVAVTGRLSCEKPNQQNLPDAMRTYITTRFK